MPSVNVKNPDGTVKMEELISTILLPAVPVLFIVIKLKSDVPPVPLKDWFVVPLKTTLISFPPLLGLNIPSFVIFPATFRLPSFPPSIVDPDAIIILPDTVRSSPPPLPIINVPFVAVPTVKFAQAASAVMVTVNPPSIKTLSPATGADAPDAPPEVVDQVAVEFQFPLLTA